MAEPTAILVSIKSDGTLGREEAAMADVAIPRGIQVVRASSKQLERKKVRVEPNMVACGSVPFVKAALWQLGRSLPDYTPYPVVLNRYLHRSVARVDSLREARARLNKGERFFIKPTDGWKRFTGFVVEFPRDMRFNGTSSSKPVWISEIVRFAGEWRAYVVEGQILAIKFADHGGNREVTPDREVISSAMHELSRSGAAPAGYALSFWCVRNWRNGPDRNERRVFSRLI